MKHLRHQIKQLDVQLDQTRAELLTGMHNIKRLAGTPRILIQGILAGFLVGYALLPRLTVAKTTVANPDAPAPPPSSLLHRFVTPHLQKHLSAERLPVTVGQIMKLLKYL